MMGRIDLPPPQLLDHDEVLHHLKVENPKVACSKQRYFLRDAPFPPSPQQAVFSYS